MKLALSFLLGIVTVFSVYSVFNIEQENPTGSSMISSVWLIASGLPQWYASVTDGCAEWSSNVLTTTGSPCGGGGSSKWTDNGTQLEPNQKESIKVDFVFATSTATSSTFAGGFVSQASSTFTGQTYMYGTTTWGAGIHPIVHGFYAADSSGLHLHSNNGTEVAYFGAGGGANITFPNYTSALLQTGASGAVAEYAGTSCTNQFVRALSALGIATCEGVDISADTNLAVTSPITLTGDTIGINQSLLSITESQISDLAHYTNADVSSYLYASTTLSNLFTAGTGVTWTGNTLNVDDSYLLNSGDVGTGVFDFGGATSFEIVNSTNPTVDADGEVAVDTTQDQFITYDGAEVDVLFREIPRSFGRIGSTSLDYALNSFDTGTSTWSAGESEWSGEVVTIRAKTNAGTCLVRVGDGTNWTETVTANSSGASDTSLSNGTFTAFEEVLLQIGSCATSPNYVIPTIMWKETRQ